MSRVDTAITLANVRETLLQVIAELESMDIEAPASLLLAAMLLGVAQAKSSR